jgi:hypothetical protein
VTKKTYLTLGFLLELAILHIGTILPTISFIARRSFVAHKSIQVETGVVGYNKCNVVFHWPDDSSNRLYILLNGQNFKVIELESRYNRHALYPTASMSATSVISIKGCSYNHPPAFLQRLDALTQLQHTVKM